MRKGEMMDDLIWRTDVVNYIEGYGIIDGYEDTQNCIRGIKALPPAQPERTKRIIGKSRDGMTMWYQCESCNEPVDEKDLFCSRCGRRFEDG